VPSGADAASSFQAAVVEVLVAKTVAVAKKHGVKSIMVVGGVASNMYLRRQMLRASPVEVLIPEPGLCTDNAAMIAACGYYRLRSGEIDGMELDVFPSMKMCQPV
jgi:N6-L-threonylcarbamoyladenine synthase